MRNGAGRGSGIQGLCSSLMHLDGGRWLRTDDRRVGIAADWAGLVLARLVSSGASPGRASDSPTGRMDDADGARAAKSTRARPARSGCARAAWGGDERAGVGAALADRRAQRG